MGVKAGEQQAHPPICTAAALPLALQRFPPPPPASLSFMLVKKELPFTAFRMCPLVAFAGCMCWGLGTVLSGCGYSPVLLERLLFGTEVTIARNI